VLVKPPGERHVDRWFDADSHHVILEPDPERHDAFGPCAGLFGEISFAVDPEAADLGHRIVRELDRADELSGLAVEGMAYELAALMARKDRDDGPSPPGWLAGVVDRMRDEYARELRLDDLARTAGVHPSYLARAFRRFYGRTVGEHLRSLRVRGAHRDLLESDVPLSRVAVRNGFCDQSHLTRVLKRETGLTPGALRSASWTNRDY
jgi:AraC family transcriptional regulator